jgi:hypothetical protein
MPAVWPSVIKCSVWWCARHAKVSGLFCRHHFDMAAAADRALIEEAFLHYDFDIVLLRVQILRNPQLLEAWNRAVDSIHEKSSKTRTVHNSP